MSPKLAGIAVVLIVSTCLGCRKAAKEMMEGAIESQIAKEGGKADVQIGDDSVSFKKAERNLQITVAVTDEGTILNINTDKDG